MDNSTDNLILEEYDEKCYFWLLTLVLLRYFSQEEWKAVFHLISLLPIHRNSWYITVKLYFSPLIPLKDIWVKVNKMSKKKRKGKRPCHSLKWNYLNVPSHGFHSQKPNNQMNVCVKAHSRSTHCVPWRQVLDQNELDLQWFAGQSSLRWNRRIERLLGSK